MITTNWLYDGDNLQHTHHIRTEVFIKEQAVPEEIELDNSDIGAIHLLVYDKIPVATGRLIIVNGQAVLGRIAVLKQYRSQGYGDLVVRMLIRKAFETGYDEQHLHAQISAQQFYEKIGFTPYGDVFYEANIPHISMMHKGDIMGNC